MGKKACLQFQISTGDPDSKDPVVRESMRSGQLNISGLLFLIIEPPDERYPYQKAEGLWIDEGEVVDRVPKNMPKLPKNLPPGAFVHWFFVTDWNSFIYLAATGTEFEWLWGLDINMIPEDHKEHDKMAEQTIIKNVEKYV